MDLLSGFRISAAGGFRNDGNKRGCPGFYRGYLPLHQMRLLIIVGVGFTPTRKLFIAFVPFVLFVVKQYFQKDAEAGVLFLLVLSQKVDKGKSSRYIERRCASARFLLFLTSQFH